MAGEIDDGPHLAVTAQASVLVRYAQGGCCLVGKPPKAARQSYDES